MTNFLYDLGFPGRVPKVLGATGIYCTTLFFKYLKFIFTRQNETLLFLGNNRQNIVSLKYCTV